MGIDYYYFKEHCFQCYNQNIYLPRLGDVFYRDIKGTLLHSCLELKVQCVGLVVILQGGCRLQQNEMLHVSQACKGTKDALKCK